MTASIEQQKQLYSKQLAEHTQRQWNAVRQQIATDQEEMAQHALSLDSEPDEPENNRDTAGHDNDGTGQSTPGGEQKANGRRGCRFCFVSSKKQIR
ncbi:hypothetical protein BDZ97DRAFT_1786929 [Flammula alnicola]|nr:hypothetical protein BDZ97DRAFT_1786929 [Flammula alnicola]